MIINTNYLTLGKNYLFSEIARRVAAYSSENAGGDIIRMGIGDVTRPLCPAVVDALTKAAQEMGSAETFRGYGPEQGYPFLNKAVRGYYARRGVELDEGEVFISDGAKSDVGNILDIFSLDSTVLVPDPVYPVYVDTNIMHGRKISYLNANESNGFLPLPEDGIDGDIIYICSPNNPTGATYSRDGLARWVAYARERGAVILFDAAYEAFITDDSLPRSIYEIEGAKECAIEFCSLSKTAGFTGTRCGYTVVPFALRAQDDTTLNSLWLRRQTTKFNGVPYIVQRGAEAVFSEAGIEQTREIIEYYRGNARIIAKTMNDCGIYYTGGENSPYIWFKCPAGMSSWAFFDYLLTTVQVVGTPGAGFGQNGEGFFRLTAFGDRDKTIEAMERFKKAIDNLEK